jgi:hypothetical protein
MKIRIGNTRLDMMGGFQQFVVAASRLLTGHDTSSASGKDFETGQGYRPVTRGIIAQNFMTNKLHPVIKFANDMAYASQHQPFAVGDRTLQLYVPLIIGDVMDLAKEDQDYCHSLYKLYLVRVLRPTIRAHQEVNSFRSNMNRGTSQVVDCIGRWSRSVSVKPLFAVDTVRHSTEHDGFTLRAGPIIDVPECAELRSHHCIVI